jgi:anti-sigma regulatory factor (Ser/Thr protein kinase)
VNFYERDFDERQREGNWPFRNYLELGALAGAVPCARLHARQLLWEWGIREIAGDLELLVSELVTNALRASLAMGQALPIRLWLLSNETRVVISVWDGNPRPPVRANAGGAAESAGGAAESGRGLVLVEALSDRWDWFAHKGLGGKVVWCELSRKIMAAVPGRGPGTLGSAGEPSDWAPGGFFRPHRLTTVSRSTRDSFSGLRTM